PYIDKLIISNTIILLIFYIMEELKDKGPDFSGFESFDTKGNKTLEKASRILRKLAEAINENNGPLGEPMIVGLHGAPGLGKSHLIDAFSQSIQLAPGINIARPGNTHHFFATNSNFTGANVIITDDLFQRAASLDDVFGKKDWDKGWYPAQKLPDFLFDLYDGKRIWIVSSNFDIKDVLKNIAQLDGQGRLTSRIEHLLASTGVLHLEGEDHRKVLAQTGTRISKLFE
ncbi:hypothetical protein KBD33_05150, partial [Candidatus Gracilibacteria bacterium]|nr:hypothetical protein [Candidatus Gracilibacteria bacterium]